MARRFSRTRFVRPAARTTLWLGSRLAFTAVTASLVTLLTTLNAAALALRPFTIIRTRTKIFFTSDQFVASEFVQAVYTKQIVTEAAAAAGVASVPDGINEPDADFFVYQVLYQDFSFADATGFQQQANEATYDVDSKAMRKVGNDDQLVSVINVASGVGAAIAIEGRILIKLH